MVALLLGSIVTLGIIQMFSSSQRSNLTLQGQARMQEAARFGLDFILRPVREAGYLGCVSTSVDVRSVLNVATPADTPFEANLIDGLVGFEAVSDDALSPVWAPAITGLPSQIDTSLIEPGTDVIVVRRASSDFGLRVTTAQVNPSSELVTELPADASLFAAGDFAVVSDCSKAALFQITAAASGTSYTMQHLTGAGTPGNNTTDLSGDATVFGTDATVFPVSATVFFVAPGLGTNNRGDNPMSLWSQSNGDAPIELVEGIEDLQVLYGEDTDANRTPNRYRTIQNITDPNDIVTVRVTVTATSVDEVSETGDGIIRRDFVSTAAVRNRIREGS